MEFKAKQLYHIYNRGNNRQRIFFDKENYLFFLSKIQNLPQPEFTTIAYCLMPNHFHFLVYTDFDHEKEVTQNKQLRIKIGSLLSSYTKAINKRYKRSGSLFRTRTKAKPLTTRGKNDQKYIQTCFHYIHQNPLRAQLVKRIESWPYSSYRDYAGFRNGSLPNTNKGREIIGLSSSKEFIINSKDAIDEDLLENIL